MKTSCSGWNVFCILVLALCFSLSGTSVAQNQYYVAATGSDTNDGSQARPWATINHANAALAVGPGGSVCGASNIGACIHVAPGTYPGLITTNRNGTSSARIRYISDTQFGARLTGGSSQIVWTARGKFTDIVGFEFDGSTNSSAWTSILTYASDAPTNVRMLNNKVHDMANTGPVGDGAGAIASCGLVGGVGGTSPCADTMEGNLIYHNNGGGASAPYCCNGNVGMDVGWGDIARNNIIMDQGGGACIQSSP